MQTGQSDMETTISASEVEESPTVWRCYCCGSTNGFEKVEYWCGDFDVECCGCSSVNTALDGEGVPECLECGNQDWFCNNCEIAKCEECWKWFPASEEPEELICKECETDMETKVEDTLEEWARKYSVECRLLARDELEPILKEAGKDLLMSIITNQIESEVLSMMERHKEEINGSR